VLLETFHRHSIVPVVGRFLPDASCHGGEVGSDRRATRHALDAARFGEQIGRADHHLARHAAVVRALSTHQVLLDPDHGELAIRQPGRHFLSSRAQPDHHDVDVLGAPVAHVGPPMHATVSPQARA
jgi:hypothetical protein